MRGRLYGDGDVEARKKLENRPLQSVQTCIEDAQMQLRIAHDQVQEILKRL
jgi:cellobiose-specific phosphotransferase system component IIA